MILHGGLLESFKENIAFALGLDEEVVFIGRYGSCPCSRQNRESVGTMNSRLGEGREVWLKLRGRAKGALGWAYLWGGADGCLFTWPQETIQVSVVGRGWLEPEISVVTQ